MDILITGITGLIGKHVAYKLVNVGGFNLKGQYFSSKNLQYFHDNHIPLVQADINQKQDIQDICSNCDTVVHAAARVIDFGTKEEFYQTHYYATQYLLEDAKKHGVKHFIYLSSIGVASGIDRKKIIPDETTPLVKTGIFYDDAKIDTEKLVIDFCAAKNMAYTIVRPSAVVGPESVWVREPIERKLNKGFFPLIDNGKQSACLLDARNLAEGIYSIITKEIAKNNIYYFMDDFTEITWKIYFADLLQIVDKKPNLSIPYFIIYPIAVAMEALANLSGKKPMIAKKSLSALAQNRLVDTRKAKEELGFQSIYKYEDTMAYIRRWVKEHYNI
jgi:nucleoside-diphosphate-sugar epimerase